MAGCCHSLLRRPSSWDTAYCPRAAVKTALVLLGLLCSWGVLGGGWEGQLYLQRHTLGNNSYLCPPVPREDASFEEDDDLSEEDEEELPPIMPAKK